MTIIFIYNNMCLHAVIAKNRLAALQRECLPSHAKEMLRCDLVAGIRADKSCVWKNGSHDDVKENMPENL